MKTVIWAGVLVCAATASSAADKPAVGKPPAPAPAPAVVAASAAPADNTEACSTLASAIDAGEEELAWIRASGVADNSAPRETTRLLNRLLERERQSQHLMMMIALKCQNLPVRSLNDGLRYYSSALRCQTALLSQRSGDTSIPDACHRKNWEPDLPK